MILTHLPVAIVFPATRSSVAAEIARIGGHEILTTSGAWKAKAKFGNWSNIKLKLNSFVLGRPHNCNKTKIKELYKSRRTLVVDQALLDIIHEHIFLYSQSQRRVVVYARPATVTSTTGCYDDIVNKILERCKSVYKDLVYIGLYTQRSKMFLSYHRLGRSPNLLYIHSEP